MNTTFEIGMTVAMLALWALAVVTTLDHSPAPMRAPVAAVSVASADVPASGAAGAVR
jgi:hypothetical protein